jgi:transposase
MSTGGLYSLGFDLGSQRHEVVICDGQGQQVGGFKMDRGRRGWERLCQEVSGLDGRVIYVVEAVQNFWQEVIHPLDAEGKEVYLVDPVKCADLRKFYSRHTKTDPIDALATARLPLADQSLPPVWVGTPEQESLKRLCRLSWKLTEQMCNHKRRLTTLLEMVLPGIGRVWKNPYCNSARLFYRRYLDPTRAKRLGRRRLGQILRRRAWGKFPERAEACLWEVIENAPMLRYRRDDLQLEVQCELDLLEDLEKRQQALRERIEELYDQVDPARLLETVPGLGYYLAAALTGAIGDVQRWGRVDHLVASTGLVPRKKASSGREKAHQPLTKRGNPQLRCWLYVAAEIVRHYDPELQAFYLRLIKRGLHHKAAICATAAKLLRRLYAVLLKKERYQVCSSQAIRNSEKPVRVSVHEVAAALLKDSGEPASQEADYSKLARKATARRRVPTGGYQTSDRAEIVAPGGSQSLVSNQMGVGELDSAILRPSDLTDHTLPKSDKKR